MGDVASYHFSIRQSSIFEVFLCKSGRSIIHFNGGDAIETSSQRQGKQSDAAIKIDCHRAASSPDRFLHQTLEQALINLKERVGIEPVSFSGNRLADLTVRKA